MRREFLRCGLLEHKVAHRHVVLTIPRLLRPLFRRRRGMLTELGRAAKDLVQWHPHVHLLTTDAA